VAGSVELRKLNEDEACSMREQLADLYERAYADKLDGAFRSRERFLERLDAHLSRPGVDLVAAHKDGQLVGYIYGFTLPAGSKWWDSFEGDMRPEVEAAARAGQMRAVAELMVVPEERRQGIARRLHDELIRGWQGQGYATMLVDPANTPARSAYESWGWKLIGYEQPFEDSPRFESRVLGLG